MQRLVLGFTILGLALLLASPALAIEGSAGKLGFHPSPPDHKPVYITPAPAPAAPIPDTKVNDDAGNAGQLEPYLAAWGDTLYCGFKDWRTGSKRIYSAVSYNAGVTWRANVIVPESSQYNYSSDVWISLDHRGVAFYYTLPYVLNGNNMNAELTWTTDGGNSFRLPEVLVSRNGQTTNDKNACDVVGDTVYADYDYSNYGQFAKSVNQGATFGAPVNIGVGGDVIGAIPQARGNLVYILYMSTGTGYDMLVKSTNGGASFGSATTAQAVSTNYYPNLPRYSSTYPPPPGYVYFLCCTDFIIDRSNGYLYAVYTDDSARSGWADALFSRSTNGGTSWSAGIPVHDSTHLGDQTCQYEPMIAQDSATGNLFCGWYDTRNSAVQGDTNTTLDYYATYSTDRGLHWHHPDTRLTSVASKVAVVQEDGRRRFGEYEGAAASKNRGFFVWEDGRNVTTGGADIYFNMLQGPSGVEQGSGTGKDFAFTLSQNVPNPVLSSTLINYELPKAADVELSVYNAMGERVRTLVNGTLSAGSHQVSWDGRDQAGKPVSSGVYLYRLSSGGEQAMKRLVVLR